MPSGGSALDNTFELLDRSEPGNEPDWIYWFTRADAHNLAGQVSLALGQPGKAETELRLGLAQLGSGMSRDRAGYLCYLAKARLGAGSVEQACTTAAEAAGIIRRLDSSRDRSKLSDFRTAAEPYAHSAAVREFDATYRDLLIASSA